MPRRSAVVVVLVALAGAAAATAGNGDKEQVRFTAADQRAARATVLQRRDLGPGAWSGGAKKPDLSPGPSCPNFHPKQSDLVLTGAAETVFSGGGVQVDNEVQILRTARMVQLDWQRTVLAPGLVSCLRRYLAKSLPAGATIVSIAKLSFPHVATYTAAYRVLVDVAAQGQTVRVLVDEVLVGRSRTEISLTISGPAALAADIGLKERAYARLLAARIKT